MALSPDGPIGGPLEAMETLLANCQAWQDWCGVSTSDDARDHVFQWYLKEKDEGGAPVYPVAVIRWRPAVEGDCRDIGSTWMHSGRLEVMFGDLVPDTYRDQDEWERVAQKWIVSEVEPIMVDVEELAGTNGYLFIDRWMIDRGPSMPPRSEGETASDPLEMVLPVEIQWSQ